jgi:spore coat polysaccharide biosynthesis predicted glycosyltransferase SpsG
MRFILRADASPVIGTGHVMRLLAIAEELAQHGQEVIFLGSVSEVKWLENRIQNFGFSEIIYQIDKFKPIPKSDILILDSYSILKTDSFLDKSNWLYIVTIMDDVTPQYNCDLVIVPSLRTDWKPYSNVKSLVGPNYVPLRKSISKVNNTFTDERTLEILVVGGGTDTLNFVGKVFLILKSLPNEFRVNLITDKILRENIDSRFSIFPPGPILDKLAITCDIVLTTASTTCLEFIARGKAIGLSCAVDNQKNNYEVLSRLKVVDPIGHYHNNGWNIQKSSIINLINNNKHREVLKSRCSNLIDLDGSKRIVRELLRLGRNKE